MIGTVAAGILAAAMIDIGGLPATLVLLAPFAVLAFVIIRGRRRPAPQPAERAEMLRAIPDTDARVLQADEPVAVDWADRIRDAEAAADHTALATLHLSFARAEMAAGRTITAADQLRASVRAATKSRTSAVQAEARLELAELARADGDLTTACEHWQIARALFHELKRQESLGETEALMRQHGCPTDWVLNDF